MKTIAIITALILAAAAVGGAAAAVNTIGNDTNTADSTQNGITDTSDSDGTSETDDTATDETKDEGTSSDETTDESDSSSESGSSDSSSSGSSGSSSSGGSSSSSGSTESTNSDDSTDSKVTTVDGFTVTYVTGTECHSITANGSEYTVTFTGASTDIECEISGTLNGNIVIDIDDSLEFKLVLNGVTITSSLESPVVTTSADKITISAKKGTENGIYDMRSAVTGDSLISSAVYSTCDMDVQGRGSLYVYSENNNGIHSKDDLDIKNLTLTVFCQDNALKGNDSVTVTSGIITLTAENGDGIKTSNNEIKTKDDGTTVQKGKVTVNTDDGDLTLTVKAMYDGIDAIYSAEFNETEGKLTVNIITGSYAGYTYTSSTSSKTATNGMFGGGPGGWMPDGNPDNWNDRDDSDSPSMKGIKGDVSILISGGTFTISSEDDAIHSDGTVTIEGGNLTIESGDDGVHADGAVTTTGGTVSITECYEGIEGSTISVSSGNITVISTDDGFNSTGTSGTGISISGGTVLIRAGGDGLDSNSQTAYAGFVLSGGDVSVISNGASDSAIDTENGYTYTGGRLIGITQSGGMSGECINCKNFSSVGTYSTVRLTSGQYATASVNGQTVTALKTTASINALVVYLGSSSAAISAVSSFSGADSNGVYWS